MGLEIVQYSSIREAIKCGLQGKEDASVRCFPTFVQVCPIWLSFQVEIIVLYFQELPKGSEKGKFLSLDLGGTNFRVIFMELTKDKVKQCSLKSLLTSKISGVHDGQQDLRHPCRHHDRTWHRAV